jgi:hypothetical protein
MLSPATQLSFENDAIVGADGAHTLTATDTNCSGQISAASSALAVTIDRYGHDLRRLDPDRDDDCGLERRLGLHHQVLTDAKHDGGAIRKREADTLASGLD